MQGMQALQNECLAKLSFLIPICSTCYNLKYYKNDFMICSYNVHHVLQVTAF